MNILSIALDVFFLAQPKASNFELKSPTNMTLSGKVVDDFEKLKVRISIWAVNGSQNQVLVVRKVDINHQGFVVGYDIKICVTVFIINN